MSFCPPHSICCVWACKARLFSARSGCRRREPYKQYVCQLAEVALSAWPLELPLTSPLCASPTEDLRACERRGYHVNHVVGFNYLKGGQGIRLNAVQVGAIKLWNDDSPDTGAARSEHLFLYTPDRQDFTSKRQLARHGKVARHGYAAKQRYKGNCERYTCRWSILRNRSRWDMQMYVMVLIKVVGNPQIARMRPHVRQRSLRRLFHNIA